MVKLFEFEAPRGKAWVNVIDGVVTRVNTVTSSQTTIKSVGGGGYVHPVYGGYVAPPRLEASTTSRTHTSVWVRDESGLERSYSINRYELPVQEGQHMRLACGGTMADTSKSDLLFVQVLETGQKKSFHLDDLSTWAWKNDLVRYPFFYRLLLNWIPLAIVAYIVLLIVPMDGFIHEWKGPEEFSWSSLLDIHLQMLAHWTPMMVKQAWFPKVGGPTFGHIFGGSIMILLLWLILRSIGYLLYGGWWCFETLRPLRREIAKVCDYSPKSPSLIGRLSSIGIGMALLFSPLWYIGTHPLHGRGASSELPTKMPMVITDLAPKVEVDSDYHYVAKCVKLSEKSAVTDKVLYKKCMDAKGEGY